MTEPMISWDDVLEVGQGGPGCGRLYIDGRQPKGNYRYLPPALFHEGKIFASTFVPGGFIVCAIDPVTHARQEVSARLPYARLKAIEGDEIVFFDRHDGDSEGRTAMTMRTGLLTKLAGGFGKR